MSYYRNIDGQKYDDGLIKVAEESVAGVGDGRVSFEDAQTIITMAKDGEKVTDIEKNTLQYIKANFKFTEKAETYFNEAVAEL